LAAQARATVRFETAPSNQLHTDFGEPLVNSSCPEAIPALTELNSNGSLFREVASDVILTLLIHATFNPPRYFPERITLL
jgi:hypothetical protein